MRSATSGNGTTIGGWLTIRYSPSTCSASFESACRLSRERAFSAVFRAPFSRFLRDLLVGRPLDRARRGVDRAHDVLVRHAVVPDLQRRHRRELDHRHSVRVHRRERRGAGVGLAETVVPRRDGEARRQALHVVFERARAVFRRSRSGRTRALARATRTDRSWRDARHRRAGRPTPPSACPPGRRP